MLEGYCACTAIVIWSQEDSSSFFQNTPSCLHETNKQTNIQTSESFNKTHEHFPSMCQELAYKKNLSALTDRIPRRWGWAVVFLPTSSKSFPSAHNPHPIGTTLTYVAAWEWHVTLSSPKNKNARTNWQETPSASLLHAPHLATTMVHTTLTERLTERQRQSLQGQKNVYCQL
jgi:hypothetical protein